MVILILANLDSGLYKFRKELIQELLKIGTVFIALPDGDYIPGLEQMGCQYIKVSMERRGLNPFSDISLYIKYRGIIRSVKPDLVITYTIKPNIYGGMACRLGHVKYAANITGLGTAFQNNGLLRKFVTCLYRVALKKAHVVFFENSDNKYTFVSNRIIPDNKTCVLAGAGVNVDYFSYADYPSDEKTTRFLFMGRVMREKGIDELFQSMKRLISEGKKCSLDVLGDYEENYESQIRLYEKEGWLHYHGFQDDVRPYIRQCHCFVLPSWHEGMANTNLECAAMGRPVITSDIPGCKEAVIECVSGYLCERKNPDSLYQKMLIFSEMDYSYREKMGILGRNHILNTFDKNKVVKKTLERINP